MRDDRLVLRYVAAGAFLALPLLCLAQAPAPYFITTVAGDNTPGFSGDTGAASQAQLDNPTGVAVDGAGTLYIVDQINNRVREVSKQIINTTAGSGTFGYSGDGAAGTSAQLGRPLSVTVDSSGNFYISDSGNNVIRKVARNDVITTFAGNQGIGGNFGGDGNLATGAALSAPAGLALDSAGNLYFADSGNNRIRKVAASNGYISTVAGAGGSTYTGDGGLATLATISHPLGVAVDSQGNIYIADTGNNVIRKVSGGKITTIVGTGTPAFSGDGGPASMATLDHPSGITLDSAGNLYIADTYNSRIRVVINGTIYTIAGTGRFGYGGDGGYALGGWLNFPTSLAVDSSGNIFIADTQNNVIREISLTLATVIPPPVISNSGVISASQFGGFSSTTPGSWIEIYGQNLAVEARPWALSDFQGNNAPTSLDGTQVTIGGQPAFVSYISSTQVNAQVPTNIASGVPQILTVTAPGGTSAQYIITVYPNQPELYAPTAFNVGGNQYVAALFSDGTTFVAPPGAIPGVPSRQAKPGDIITLYGIGFGPVTPSIPAGQIVQQNNTLATNLTILFGNTTATTTYQGLAPTLVGLYQLNVVVPQVPNNDLVPLSMLLGGGATSQTLFTAVHN